MPRRGSADAEREKIYLLHYCEAGARYVFGEIGYHFEALSSEMGIARYWCAHERLFSCFVADDYYWCSLRKWKVSWRSTRAEHDLIVRHKIKSARIRHPSGALTEIRENITLYMRACDARRGFVLLCLCAARVYTTWWWNCAPAEYGREHDKYIIPAPVTIICSDDDEAGFIVWGNITILRFISNDDPTINFTFRFALYSLKGQISRSLV